MNIDGKSLERATELIENHILNHIEKSQVGQVKIETNKLFVVNGVRHEVDIYVTVDLKIGTTLIYIFECKNYKTQVISKNDIIIFDEKIDVLGAQKGYFVAREFGIDSINRAKQNIRIELLTVSTSSIFDGEAFMKMKSVFIEDCKVNIVVKPAFPIDDEFQYLPIKVKDKEPTTINNLVSEKISNGEKDIEIKTCVKTKDYWEFVLTYDNPVINEIEFENISLTVMIKYKQEEPELIYDFDVEGKGRYVKIRMKDLYGKKHIIMELTKIDNSGYKFHQIYGEE